MLVQAFAELRAPSASAHKLLVVGLNTSGVDLEGIARGEGIGNDFRYVEYVSDEDLSLLYSGAEAFVLPYTYEALSLTALEAQAAGCPVLTVDTPGLREQTGGHALFIPKADTPELAAAMRHLGDDDALRGALVAGGLAHASRFTWERCSHRDARRPRRSCYALGCDRAWPSSIPEGAVAGQRVVVTGGRGLHRLASRRRALAGGARVDTVDNLTKGQLRERRDVADR